MDRIAALVPIETRFRELDGQTRRLCATRLRTSEELVDHFADALLPKLHDTDVSPDWACEVARNLAHAAGRVYRGVNLPRWDVSVEVWDPALGDPGAARIATGRFRDVTVLAAHAANVVSAGTTNDEAVDAWLDLLKKESPHCDIHVQRINSLARASAGLCVRLAARLPQTSPDAAPHATQLAILPPVAQAVVATLMGWSSATTTRMAKRYAHFTSATLRQAMETLDAPVSAPPERPSLPREVH